MPNPKLGSPASKRPSPARTSVAVAHGKVGRPSLGARARAAHGAASAPLPLVQHSRASLSHATIAITVRWVQLSALWGPKMWATEQVAPQTEGSI
jgi:hypothetical protein